MDDGDPDVVLALRLEFELWALAEPASIASAAAARRRDRIIVSLR